MSNVERAVQVLVQLLSLYPRRFRAEFAEEMEDVLTANLGAAASRGLPALTVMLVHEILGLLHGALREHRRMYLAKDLDRNDRAVLMRRLAQGIAVISGIWWLLVPLMNDVVHADVGMMGVVILLAFLGAILAPWYRKASSCLVFTGGLLIVVMMLLEAFLVGGAINIALAIMSGLPLLAAGSMILDAPALDGHRNGAMLTTLLGIVALTLSWWGFVVIVGLLTERWLTPWDTWAEPVRPSIGTWQRSVNDFFEGELGAHVPAATLIGAGVLVLLARLRAAYKIVYMLWFVAAANLAVSIVGLVALPVLDTYHASTPEQIGYRYTWPGILILLLSCAALLSLARSRGESRADMSPDQA